MTKTEIMLNQAKAGNLGTPEKPHRGNSLHWCFWAGYFGWRTLRDYERDTAAWHCVKAGQLFKKQPTTEK